MSDVSDLFDRARDAIVLNVHVQPGAGRSAVVGRHGDALKIRVASPPVGGRANTATMALIAETFDVPAADVEVASGDTSRSKRIRLRGVDPEEFERRLRLLVEQDRPQSPGRR